MSTIFGPSSASATPVGMINRLYNGDFTFCPSGTVVVADGATVFVSWYVLTQSGTVTVSQLSYPEAGQFACMRITQSSATAQRFGYAQRIQPEDCGDLRTALFNASGRLRFSDEANLRWAILASTSGTLDVVNDWTSATYTPGQFFISSVEVVNQGIFRTGAGAWGEIPQIPYQGPDDLVYLQLFVWTQDTVAQNGTLDAGLNQIAAGVVTQPFEHRPYDLNAAIEFAPSPAWGAVITQSTIGAGQALIDTGQPFTDVASASTTTLANVNSNKVRITGTTTITSFGSAGAGLLKTVRFAAALTLTHNGTSLILPGGGNIVTAANDCLQAVSLGSGNWIVTDYQSASAFPPSDPGVTPDQFGAAGNNVANDTSAVNSALAAVATSSTIGEVTLKANETYLVTALDNELGVRFRNWGRIVKQSTQDATKRQQLTTYADNVGHHFIGKEYVYRLFARAANGQSGSSGRIGAFFFGDSTVSGTAVTTPFLPNNIFETMMRNRGVGNLTATNRGVSGTNWTDLNALPDLGATTDIIFIKYGIGDATFPLATRLQDLADNMAAKLSAIRAHANGGLDDLAIVLVGPNTVDRDALNINEEWFEQIRGIYQYAARTYTCAYFDTYGFLRDSRNAAGLWMDDIGGGVAAHPKDNMNAQIWGAVTDMVCSIAEAAMYGSNQFTNLTAGVEAPQAAAAPSAYRIGQTISRFTSGNGWPEDGGGLTVINPDSVGFQMNWAFQATRTRLLVRTYDTLNGVWTGFSGRATALTLQNGWVAYGGAFGAPSYWQSADGTIFLSGMMKDGTVTAATLIATLPANFRPAADQIFCCAGNASFVFIKIASDGQIILQSTGDATFTSLAGISFLAA